MEAREIRKKSKLTQEEMARKCHVSIATVKRWEAGNARPSPLAQRQLARLERKLNK
uniref:Putative DNA binding, helix-turn-helix domain containing protein n=1 Tax=viral metagenome TaxID=1070528 RepID=A0A6M3LRU0_9ZZZZ